MENRVIPLNEIEVNWGQIPGVPANPRWWAREELDKLKKSLNETPELFNARGCVVFPYEGKYVVLGGNMRYVAAKEMGVDVPCHILAPDTDAEKLKEIIIKDNASFGNWDASLEEWEVPDYWGVQNEEWQRDDEGTRAHQPKEEKFELNVQFTPEEFLFVQSALGEYGETKEDGLMFLLDYGKE